MRALALLLLATVSICGCGKKKPGAKTTEATPVAVQPTLLTESVHLGLAARVPSDVEFCLSTVHFRQHSDALTGSRWWKNMQAYLEDKTPASDGAFTGLQVDEAFIAFGKGSAQEIAVLRQLNDFYNETAYRGLMSGGELASLGTSFNLAKMLNAAMADAQMLESLILLLERFEVPSLMLGVSSPEPEKVLKAVSDSLRLSTWMGDAPQSRIVTTQGEQITVNELAMSSILTVEHRRECMAFLTQTAPNMPSEMRDRIARGLDVLAGKRWVLALGFSKDRGYVAVAQNKAQVRLASSVEDSILARPELRFADGQAQNPGLGLIACWDGAFLDVLQSDEPFHPIVRGAFAGLRAEKTFADATRALEPLVTELGAAEHTFFHNEHTTGAAIAWWEKGLRVVWEGGVNKRNIPTFSKPSRFTPLLDESSVVFGLSGQGSGAGAGRAYFEAWMKLAHATADRLIQAGVGGEQAANALKEANAITLPAVLEIYEGSKTIWQKGLDSDGAFVLDIGGKMPSLPGLPPGADSLPLPRLALAQNVKNRRLLDVSWQNMESTLQNLIQRTPYQLPPVVTKRQGKVTSHAYSLPFESDDLVPCISLSEGLFMAGTSSKQQQQMADTLGQPESKLTVGRRVKLNFRKLREFSKAFADVQQGRGAENFKRVLQYLAPLEAMDLRVWGDNGVARGTLTCGMHDILTYD